MAGVPVRLVVEAIIELMGASWIDVHSSGKEVSFEATESGRKVAEMPKLPEDMRTLRRRTTLCMDRLTTSFFEPEDLVLVHADKLPENPTLLKPRAFKLNMTPSNSLERLYMMEDETFQEWIDQRVTSQRFFAAVTIIGGTVSAGLPGYTPQSLYDAIAEETTLYDGKSEVADEYVTSMQEPAESFYAGNFFADDLIVGGEAHLGVVKHALAQAKSFVLFHTCFVHPDAVKRILPAVEAAAKRGVVIDLLWGQRNNELQEWSRVAFQQVKEIFENISPALRPKIRFSDRETGSHAKIIISDSGPEGAYEAYVGSCNWLSSKYSALEVSIRLREPKLVASVAALLATLRIPTSGRWTPDVYRLVDVRNKLFRQLSKEPSNGSAAILVDREHLRAVRHARDEANERILAGCDLYGPSGETSVFVPMRTASNGGVKVTLFYNNLAKSMESDEAQGAIASLAERNITVRKSEILHGKFLLWDGDTILISSFNWLATNPSPWKPTGAEVGILVKVPGIANALLDKLVSVSDDFVELPEMSASPVSMR
jgi:hypothetical protein